MLILFFIVGSLFSFAAFAQSYPVSGVWIAREYPFFQFTAGACFALKKIGVDALFLRGHCRRSRFFRTASDLWCREVAQQSEQLDPLRA